MSEYFYYTTPDHPLAEPLVTQLTAEYDRRYGSYFGETADKEMSRYPAALFAPPEGNFLLLLRDGFPIAGGAFKRYDAVTAELKRIANGKHLEALKRWGLDAEQLTESRTNPPGLPKT